MTAVWLVVASLVAVAAAICAVTFYRRAQCLQRELHRLEARRLRSQLNPHFLFNALTAVSELGYHDPGAADRTVTQLSNLLRISLDTDNRYEIALKDELDILRRYLDIQQTLLQNRLRIQFNVATDTLSARVPSMILQPLAENAVTHGITATRGGCIDVAAHRDGEMLVLEIRDDGPGLQNAGPERVGLSNTRDRLAHLYGNAQDFELKSAADGWTVARIRLPFHEAWAYDEDAHANY
ncbi:MAG TPA: histidine kinase [Gammaproteobacteria bacterium]|nr:histidine kinase [Gammaproteobacteria bacterium]HET7587593.1 histidine kinase [Gammaproteobacteria bacterium]